MRGRILEFQLLVRRSSKIFVAVAALTLPAWSVAGETEQGGSFHEEFDRLDDERWYVSNGWSNGPHQNCVWSDDQVSTDGGILRLAYSRREPIERAPEPGYVCGELQTKQRFGYGAYEARLKAVERSGFNSAFFSYIGPVHGAPHDEIDFEILGKDATSVQLNQFVRGEARNGTFVPVPENAARAFNTYAFIWEPGRLRYYVNGSMVHEVTDAASIPKHPMKILASLWASDTALDWLGPFDPPHSEPLIMEVDWIAYTALDQPCRFAQSILCEES